MAHRSAFKGGEVYHVTLQKVYNSTKIKHAFENVLKLAKSQRKLTKSNNMTT
ncbi:hypothetical protein VINI7043_18049 [Vibrio nigripulchritudo ATCC 27043]|nr:hypothetical protein VINI7043_18049 [Vibrio nigripulchritudo ATCC 27043]